MRRKAVSGMMLTLLLIGMLTLAFDIQPVESDWAWTETIYIMADGSVDPPTAPISTVDNITYTLTNNIVGDVPERSSAIVVERDNIVVNGAGYTIEAMGFRADFSNGIDLRYRNNVTFKNVEVTNFWYGIYLNSSSNNVLSGNNASPNAYGIYLYSSSNNIISGNNITYGCIYLGLSSNNTVFENNITNNMGKFGGGIWLDASSNNIISGNNITNNYDTFGIYFKESSNNTVSGNNITNNYSGIGLEDSSNNTVFENNIANNDYGIELYYSSNNTIYHNNFVDNWFYAPRAQVYSYESTNVWDDGYPSGGNYWSDYTDVDVKSGPNQDQPSSDGIGDTPYVIDENNTDNYPLMHPWDFPLYTLTIYSSPAGVMFTIVTSYCKGVSRTTPWSGNYSAYYNRLVSLIMPQTHIVGGSWYCWDQWDDGVTSRLRIVTMNTSVTLTAYYTGPYSEPPEPEPSEETLGIFNFIESLTPGDVVILNFDFNPSNAPENYPQAKAFLFHCKQLGLRVIGIAFWRTGAPIGEEIFTQVYGEDFQDLPEYGTEFVYLGYIPGHEVGMQTFGDKTWLAKPVDHFGNSFSDLPIMDEVRSAEDFDLWMELMSGTPGVVQVIQFVQGRHGGPAAVPVGAGCTEVCYLGIKPYYDSGQLVGVLWGKQGTFEYEWLLMTNYGYDITPPLVTILSPENTTYTTTSVPLTFTINEDCPWIGYSLDNQANVTITGNTTLTGLSDGVHSITVYANDAAGNMGTSDTVYFTITLKTLLGTGWGWMRLAHKEYVHGRTKLYKIGDTEIELVITYQGEEHSRTWNIIFHREYKYGERYLCYSKKWGFLIVGLHEHRRWQFWHAVGRGAIAFGFPRFGRLRLMPI